MRAHSVCCAVSARERREAAADEEPIPARAVLVEQQDGLSGRADPRHRARRLDLHERDEPVHLGLLGEEPGQDAAEPERVIAERRPHPVVASRRRVALVEDEVDDLEHRRETSGPVGAARNLEGHARLGERALGPDDALGDRRLGDEEGPGDLPGRQAPEQAERERDPRLGGEHRMARDEGEPEEVVAESVVDRGVEIRRGLLSRIDFAAELLMLALEQLAPAQQVDCTVLRRGHEPCARVLRDARLGPLLERRDERVLG